MDSFHNKKIGEIGEDIAADYLSNHGYKIVGRNERSNDPENKWELDIITVKDQTLVFVEVKSRLSTEYGNPEEAVTKAKLRTLRRAAQFYHYKHPYYPELFRIDVVSVILEDITYKPLEIKLFIDATT